MHVHFDPKQKPEATTTFDQFMKVDIRLGQITDVQDYPEARNPCYKLKINFGETIGAKKSIAQIKDLYSAEHLMEKKVFAIVNFEPRQVGKSISEVLVLGLSNHENHIVLYDLDYPVPLGSRLV